MADMVRHSDEHNSGSKIFIPLIIVLVFVFVALFFVIKFYNSSRAVPDAVITSVTAQTTLPPKEVTTQSETTTQIKKVFPDGEGEISAKGRFYISGTLYSNKSSDGVHITAYCDGENSQICAAYSNMWLGILTLDGKKYFVDLISRSYIDYSEAAFKQLGVQSIPFDIPLFGDFSNQQFIEIDATLENEKGKSYIAQKESYAIEIITGDGKLKQINVTDSATALNYCIIAEEISAQIPTDRLTLTGFTKSTSLFSFFSAVIH